MSLPSRNLYKCKQVACSIVVICLFAYPLFLYCTLLLPIYFFIPLFYCNVVVPCSLLYYFFILMVLLDFCLFVDHVNKPIIFVFEAFVYDFRNTISIAFTLVEFFFTILSYADVYCCIFVYLFAIFLCRCTIICKQVCLLYCFVVETFVYNFNVRQCRSKTAVS